MPPALKRFFLFFAGGVLMSVLGLAIAIRAGNIPLARILAPGVVFAVNNVRMNDTAFFIVWGGALFNVLYWTALLYLVQGVLRFFRRKHAQHPA